MPRGQEGDAKSAHFPWLSKRQDILTPLSRHARLHQPGGSLRDNDFLVRGNVIAVGVRDEGKRLRIPGIEPDFILRQIDPSFVLDPNHGQKIIALTERREPAR